MERTRQRGEGVGVRGQKLSISEQAVAYESAALEGGGLTYADLQRMEFGEFLEHLVAARKRLAAESVRLMGAIGMFSPHVKPDSRKAFMARLAAEARFGDAGDDVRAVYEGHSIEDRLRIIGSVLNSKAVEYWRQANHGQLEWLRENGLTEDDARRAHREWSDRLTANAEA